MSKNRPQPPPQYKEGSTPSAQASRRASNGKPHLVLRILVSVVTLWHLFAVIMAPLSLPPTSQLATTIAQGPVNRPSPLKWFEASPMQWYLDALYLNHGYSFFAPSPGPGHLVRYRVTDARGQVVAEGEFPDVKEHWPRLRYHRHFMLSDQAELPLPRREPDAAQRLSLEKYGDHLLTTFGGSHVRLVRVRHFMLSPREKMEGVKLDAPHKYETVGDPVELNLRNSAVPARSMR